MNLVESVRVETPADFDLSLTLTPYKRFPDETSDIVIGNSYIRCVRAESNIIVFRVSQQYLSCAYQTRPLTIDIWSTLDPRASEIVVDDLVKVALSSVGADLDLTAFNDLCLQDPPMHFVVRKLNGMYPVSDVDSFDSFVSTILGQLISIKAAAVIRRRFIHRFSDPIVFNDCQVWPFPRPADVLKSSVDEIASLGMTRKKAEAILFVADACTRGELEPAVFRNMTDPESIRFLCDIPGIGPWSAEWYLFNRVRRSSVLPAGDLAVRRQAGKLLLNEYSPSPRAVRIRLAPFAGYQGYAAYYLLSEKRVSMIPAQSPDPSIEN